MIAVHDSNVKLKKKDSLSLTHLDYLYSSGCSEDDQFTHCLNIHFLTVSILKASFGATDTVPTEHAMRYSAKYVGLDPLAFKGDLIRNMLIHPLKIGWSRSFSV